MTSRRPPLHYVRDDGPLPPIDPSTLNPGIRNAVAWLRARGFDTCDSGDGATHEHECDLNEPYVHILVSQEEAFEATDRLAALLAEACPFAFDVQLTYAPGTATTISVFGGGLLLLHATPEATR